MKSVELDEHVDPNSASVDALTRLDQIETELQSAEWSYDEAFCRNRGLISEEEQQRLRTSRVAIAGLGGVGGVHLVTLARLGIGRFTIADPDTFETANINRQYGARTDTRGRSKAEVMAEEARRINPDIDIRIVRDRIGPDNAHQFLADADVLVDAIDAFSIDSRRLLFRLAAERGIMALGAGPVGFSTVWVTFAPDGMSYDRYFDFSDEMDEVEKFVAYIMGMAPAATQRTYLDPSYVNFESQSGPSVCCACHLAAGVVGAEVAKILLGRGRLRVAPCYFQFDPYIGRLVRGRLRGGNRHPLQRLKRWWVTRYLRSRGPDQIV